jgi:hypothetical protein
MRVVVLASDVTTGRPYQRDSEAEGASAETPGRRRSANGGRSPTTVLAIPDATLIAESGPVAAPIRLALSAGTC